MVFLLKPVADLAIRLSFADQLEHLWGETVRFHPVATIAFRDLEPKLVLYLERALRGRYRARVDRHVIPNVAMD
jgi:hypothetical protein